MKKIILSLSVIAFSFTSCGPDSILVESGKIHSCKIRELSEKLKADPDNAELKEEILETGRYLESVIETAEEGDRAALQEAIVEASKDCK